MKNPTPTKEKVKKVKAWIEIYPKVSRYTPTIWFGKPDAEEMEIGSDYGCKFYPCVIHYKLPLKK